MVHPPQGNNTGDGDFESLSTEDALNSEIGDGVDYLDPHWVANTDAIVVNRQPSTAAEWNSRTTGSGSVSYRFWTSSVETGTTADSTATLSDQLISRNRYNVNQNLFQSSVTARLPTAFRTGPSTNAIVEWGIGDVDNNDNGKAVFIRRTASGDLEGVVNDGTGETTTTLISNFTPNTTADDVLITFTPSEAIFTVDGTEEGSISSGLPSGGSKLYVAYKVDNNGDASNTELGIDELSVVIGP